MRILLVMMLAACSAAPAVSGPRWPQEATRSADGGESIAPRAAARAIAAVVEEDKPERSAADKSMPPATPSTASPAGGGDKPAATAPAATESEEPLTTEGIVIEIED